MTALDVAAGLGYALVVALAAAVSVAVEVLAWIRDRR